MRSRHIVRGVLAGAAGGLAASWLMNQFMTGPGTRLRHVVQNDEQNREEQEHSEEPGQSATMKAAEAIVSTATSGHHLSWDEQQKAAPMVHYGFGAFAGAIYGGLAEYSSTVKTGFGTGFGSILFGAADLVAVPALNLSALQEKQSASSLVSPFSAHIVYGVTTELVRRTLRAIF